MIGTSATMVTATPQTIYRAGRTEEVGLRSGTGRLPVCFPKKSDGLSFQQVVSAGA